MLAVSMLAALVVAAFLAHASAAADAGRTVPRAFTVTSITPNTGVSGEGVHVTVNGSGFDRHGHYTFQLTQGSTVIKGGTPRVDPSGTQLLVVVLLSGAPLGAYDVVVGEQTSGESHTLAGAFTVTGSPSPSPTTVKPKITSISPKSGKRGSKVTVRGSGFGKARGAGYMKFGAKKCTKYISWSATKIACKVPAKAAFARVKVKAITPAGASNAKYFTVRRN
jgi:hypothetical protein